MFDRVLSGARRVRDFVFALRPAFVGLGLVGTMLGSVLGSTGCLCTCDRGDEERPQVRERGPAEDSSRPTIPTPRRPAQGLPELREDRAQRPPESDDEDVRELLSPEERALLDADFASLSAEEKAARAVVLKKQVMNDPSWEGGARIRRLEEDVSSGEYAKRAASQLYGGSGGIAVVDDDR